MAAAVAAVVVVWDEHSNDVCIISLLYITCKKNPLRLNGVGMMKQIRGLLGANGFLQRRRWRGNVPPG